MLVIFFQCSKFQVIEKFTEVQEVMRRLEYIGQGKNQLKSERQLRKLCEKIGKIELTQEQHDEHEEAVKNRHHIIEKNKKLRQLKKTEDIVPFLDPVYQDEQTKGIPF